MRRLFVIVLMLVLSRAALADDAWWHQVPANTAKNDGSITLLDANGNPMNMVANPTAAMVKPNQAAVTQPPTVIVQATTGYWKDPVAAFSSLPTTGNQVGDTRMVTTLGRAFSWNGGSWQPLAADQNGTMRTNDFQATNVVAQGTGCPENGRQARDGNGAPLFCQSGVWTAAGGFTRIMDGTFQPPEGGCSTQIIADPSWKTCSISGINGMGQNEWNQIFQSGGYWYMRGCRLTWNGISYYHCQG